MNSEKTLKKQVVQSSFWLFGGNIISRVVSLISTLILAKLLSPEDFGVIGYGFLVVQTIGLFREMGFNSALIYQKENIEEAASTAFWFSLVWSIFLYLIIFLCAPIVASFFREPKLNLLLKVLPISLIISSASSIPMTLMEKSLNFKLKVIPDVVHLIAYGIITVILAFFGLKFWAFVIGTLVSGIIQLIIAFKLRPIKINFKIDYKILKEMFGFGKNVMGLGVIYFGIRNIDDFFVGRMLGTTPLGIYQFSYRIANIPATNISNVLGKILYPSFVKIAGSTWELRNAFLKSFRYVAFITIPITFYIILVIPDFITLFYPKWMNAIIPIQLIAYFGGLRAIGSGMGSVFLAKGKPNLLLPIAIIQLLILSIIIYPLVHLYGVVGACWAINISITFSFFATFWRLKKIINYYFKQVVEVIMFPLLVSIILYLLMIIFSEMLKHNSNDFQYLIFSIKLVLFPVLSIICSYFFTDTLKNIIKDFTN